VPQEPLSVDNKELHDNFIAQINNPFIPYEELKKLFMLPLPPRIGQIRCTIVRDKSGWNKFYPKYICKLSDSNKNLLVGKKKANNTTSNY